MSDLTLLAYQALAREQKRELDGLWSNYEDEKNNVDLLIRIIRRHPGALQELVKLAEDKQFSKGLIDYMEETNVFRRKDS